MTAELAEIADFLSHARPFSDLIDEERAITPPFLTVHYARRDTEIIRAGIDDGNCFAIHSDVVNIFDPAGILLDRRGVGGHFGHSTLLSSDPPLYTMMAVEDCAFLAISEEVFDQLDDQFVEIRRCYGGESVRIHAVASKLRSTAASGLLHTRIADLMETSLVTYSADATVQEAAQIMMEQNVSSLFMMKSVGANQSPSVGIITDRDLHCQVLAKAKPAESLVSKVMTGNPGTIGLDLLVFETMLLVTERSYHHSSVHDGTRVVGMVVTGDLLHGLHTDPVYVMAMLARKDDISEITEIAQNARQIVGQFIDRGNPGGEIAGPLTAVADAVIRHLIALVKKGFGPPPASYVFAMLGPHRHGETGLASDQDNTLILAGGYGADSHPDFFAALSDGVCTNLDRIGCPLRPGDVMVGSPAWRTIKSQWLRTFYGQITAPETRALLRAQTFFNMRGMVGDVQLVEELRTVYLPLVQGSQHLHAHLAKFAAWREPPLGLLHGLALGKGGEHAKTLDIKKGGTAATAQMARLSTVAAGLLQLSTYERLAANADTGNMSHQGIQDLADVFEFLCAVQLDHQQVQLNADEQSNDHIHLKRLSSLGRKHLYGAFGVIRKLRRSLGARCPVWAMS